MTNEEIFKKITKPTSKEYVLKSIENVDHDPHPYCITEKHLRYNDSMYLGEDQIKVMEKEHGPMCGMYVRGNDYCNSFKSGYSRCTKTYDEHTSKKVLFIKALVDKEVKDLENIKEYLKSVQPTMLKYKLDGVGFIAPDKPDDNK